MIKTAQVCPKCEGHIPDPDMFCPHCGAELDRKDDLNVGQVINGAYAVRELIGGGSMGRVYLAEQLSLKKTVALWEALRKETDDLISINELLKSDKDDKPASELAAQTEKLGERILMLETRTRLSGEHDANNAIVSIHAGAGGTESCDWAEMLLRMYNRWAEKKGFAVEIIDILPGEEAGVKSVTLLIKGEYAYGLLRAEVGVHRLVRLSPFDFNQRRHTSFAAVFVYPEVQDDLEVEIEEKDLRMETFRAGGHGGQNVNKVSSAVRMYHLPSGIVVQCQNERSQHQNRMIALRILKSRLLELKRKEEDEKREKLYQEQKQIAWGSQIRSYILHPYRMVKDHRTGQESSAVEKVLDGALHEFIRKYLLTH